MPMHPRRIEPRDVSQVTKKGLSARADAPCPRGERRRRSSVYVGYRRRVRSSREKSAKEPTSRETRSKALRREGSLFGNEIVSGRATYHVWSAYRGGGGTALGGPEMCASNTSKHSKHISWVCRGKRGDGGGPVGARC